MENVQIHARVLDDTLAAAYPDNTDGPVRQNKNLELVTDCLTRRQRLTLEGSYFRLRNATPGTGIAGHPAATAYDSTKPLVYLKNDYTVAEDKKIILDYVQLQFTAAGAGATTFRLITALDEAATARRTSGGTALAAGKAPFMGASGSLSATCYVGPVVAPAESANVRHLMAILARSVVPVVGDIYRIKFGAESESISSMIVAGTAIVRQEIPHCPVILGPGEQFLLHEAGASQSGAHSWEIEIGCFVR